LFPLLLLSSLLVEDIALFGADFRFPNAGAHEWKSRTWRRVFVFDRLKYCFVITVPIARASLSAYRVNIDEFLIPKLLL